MKNIVILLACLLLISCGKSENKYSVFNVVGNYGEEISAEGAISTTAMMIKLVDQDSLIVKVESEIVATCAMKGCWMNLVLEDGQEMRVTFKDYAFFVPKEGMQGNHAIIEGMVKRTLTDVATLQHYAEDAGKSETEIAGITTDKEELTFEATGVIILDSATD